MKRKILVPTAVLLSLCCLFSLCSCNSDIPVKREFFAMDTYMSIRLYGQSASLLASGIEAQAQFIDAILSVSDENSDVYKINHAGGKAVSVDSRLPSLIEESKALCEDLSGSLDISLYPVLSAWGFTTQDYRVPSKDEIDGLLEKVDHRLIDCDEENNTVTVPDGMMLDFGAVAKGYLADLAAKELEGSDSVSGILNFGGTILPWGKKNGAELWTVGIGDPKNPSMIFATLSLSETVISTSGGYERYFIGEDGRTYIHIIDPKTGYPVDNGVLSVTVVCESGIAADALSTALFVMGEEEAARFYENNTKYNFDFVILKEDNTLLLTEGIADCFSLCDGYDCPVTVIKKA